MGNPIVLNEASSESVAYAFEKEIPDWAQMELTEVRIAVIWEGGEVWIAAAGIVDQMECDWPWGQGRNRVDIKGDEICPNSW